MHFLHKNGPSGKTVYASTLNLPKTVWHDDLDWLRTSSPAISHLRPTSVTKPCTHPSRNRSPTLLAFILASASALLSGVAIALCGNYTPWAWVASAPYDDRTPWAWVAPGPIGQLYTFGVGGLCSVHQSFILGMGGFSFARTH